MNLLRTILMVTIAAGISFVDVGYAAEALAPARVTAEEIPWPDSAAKTGGTGMRPGLQTLVIAGDAKAPGLFTMLFKLPAARYQELADFLTLRHSYDEPEIVATPIVAGSAGYLSWLEEETQPG